MTEQTQPTEYLVLERVGTNYALVGSERASGPVAAAKKMSDSGGMFLVVPTFNAHFVELDTVQPEPVMRGKVLSAQEALDIGQTSLVPDAPEEAVA